MDELLQNLSNVVCHRLLLHLALEETRGSAHPVLAMGLDPETTGILRDICDRDGRLLVSLEEDIFAAAALRPPVGRGSSRHEILCCAFDAAPIEARGPWSVAVLDHAPGERRKDDALRLLDRCEVIVLHDTEPDADSGYQFSTIWGRWRQRVDVKTGGAWASAISSTRDLSRWRGYRSVDYVVTMGDEEVGENVVGAGVQRMFDVEREKWDG